MKQQSFQVKAFEDQDAARVAMADRAADATARILILMDMVTSGGGGLAELEKAAGVDAAEYLAFRRWFGPQIQASLQAFAGEVLAATTIDDEGLVNLDFARRRAPPSPRSTLANRITWLIAEIILAQDEYAQIYPKEWAELQAVFDEANAIDTDDDAQIPRGIELWQTLETAYRHAQPGARIYRGDEASIEAARRTLGKYADQIAAKEAVIRDRQRVIAGELETRDPAELVESIREAQGMVAQHKEQRERAVAQQVAHTDAIARLQANIHDLVLALPEGVEPPE